MKVTFKDLKQNKLVVEAEPTNTIGELKAKIRENPNWEGASDKLVYSGKVLQDDQTVETCKISEKGFVVCVPSKTKAAPSTSKAAPSTPAPAPTQTPSAPAQSSTANTPATPSPAPQPSATPGDDSFALTSADEREAAIADMVSMGFDRAESERAMRAAFYNRNRAVEYMFSGIPDSALQDAPASQQRPPAAPAPAPVAPATTSVPPPAVPPANDQPINLFEAAAQAGQAARGAGRPTAGAAAAAAAAAAGGAALGAGAAAGGAAPNNLDFLRNLPQFQQLRQLVQQQPQMLEPILQQVGEGNPQLAEMIAENQEAFLRLLTDDAGEDEPLPPGAQVISVTEEERSAIDRLCTLGFNRDLVIQAYFACDRNEELAANFLFDQPEEPEE